MRFVLLLGAIAYWLFLTVLLLAPNPAGLVGLSEIPMFPWGKFGIHLSAFIGLTILIHASRWPRRLCWPLFVFLLAYGLATESLQAFVPTRTVRLMDYTENILGVFIGSAVYWLVQRIVRPLDTMPHLASELVRCAAKADAAGE
jgi:hypothetical protein